MYHCGLALCRRWGTLVNFIDSRSLHLYVNCSAHHFEIDTTQNPYERWCLHTSARSAHHSTVMQQGLRKRQSSNALQAGRGPKRVRSSTNLKQASSDSQEPATCHNVDDRPSSGSLESPSMIAVDDKDDLTEVLTKLELDDEGKLKRPSQQESERIKRSIRHRRLQQRARVPSPEPLSNK